MNLDTCIPARGPGNRGTSSRWLAMVPHAIAARSEDDSSATPAEPPATPAPEAPQATPATTALPTPPPRNRRPARRRRST